MMNNTPSPIGLIGLGLVGSALAHRLNVAGYKLIGYDIDQVQCEAFTAAGHTLAASTREVAERCGRIVLSLPDSNIVESVLLQDDGFLSQTNTTKIIVDTTTGEPSQVRSIAEEVRKRGSCYCDACIIGSSVMIHDGEGVIVLGVDEDTHLQIEDILTSISDKTFNMGEPGSGSDTKLVVNLAIGLHRLVLSESLVLAESLGLNLPQILEVLKSGVSYSKVMDTKGAKMIESNFEPQARLKQHFKDVKLINALGKSCHAPLPLSNLHESILERGIALGLGGLDNSAVIEILRRGIE